MSVLLMLVLHTVSSPQYFQSVVWFQIEYDNDQSSRVTVHSGRISCQHPLDNIEDVSSTHEDNEPKEWILRKSFADSDPENDVS